MLIARRVLALLLVGAACAALPAIAQAQAWPSKSIQLVVPAAAAGSTDLFARKFSQRLEKQLATSIVIVNKGGGGGSIGTGEVARAAPDGYTLLMGTTGNVVLNPLTMALNFDPARELTPVAVVGFVPFAVAVWPGLNVNSVKELVALVKASPGKYSYGTNGPAGIIHLITELFSQKADLKMVAIPYPGGITVQQDLISGRIQIYFDAFNSALRFHKTGQVKVLATTGGTRMAAAPDIPTVEEAGMPDYVAETAFILMAPAGTAAPVIERLLAATRKVVVEPEFQKELEEMAVRPVLDSNPKAAAEYIRMEHEKWTPIVRSVKAGS